MNQDMVLAVPSSGAGGLDGARSPHFGRCDCFTLVRLVDGRIVDVKVADNPPHEHAGCLRPVELLALRGVTDVVVAGIGPRPLTGFHQAGIAVYCEDSASDVREAVRMVAANEAPLAGERWACHCHDHEA